MTTYQYMTAQQWGGVWVRPPVTERLLDPECYVHHTAGSHPADAALAFRQMNDRATRPVSEGGKGYSFLDYDVLVHYNAANDLCTIGEGRGPWMSAATKDRNEQGEAVCLLGYFHPGHSLSRQPHPAELEGVARGIVWGMAQGWIAPDAKIMGHRDNPAHPGATACPGDYLYAQLPTIRQRVQALMTTPDLEAPMIPLATPRRVYDSRQAGGELQPNTVRKVPLGTDVAQVHVTVVGRSRGFVSVSGTDTIGGTSLVNVDTDVPAGGATVVRHDTVTVRCPDQQLRVQASMPCHVVVDLYGTRSGQ